MLSVKRVLITITKSTTVLTPSKTTENPFTKIALFVVKPNT